MSSGKENNKAINLSPHASEKLKRLKLIGVTEDKIKKTIREPENLVDGYFGRKIAQSFLTDELLLRVIFEETDNSILVIPIYPGKRSRYE